MVGSVVRLWVFKIVCGLSKGHSWSTYVKFSTCDIFEVPIMFQSEWMHSFRSLMTKVHKGHIRFSKWLPRLCQLSQQLPCCTTITAIKGIDFYLWTLKGFTLTFIVEAQANFLSEISFSLKLHHDARNLLCLTQVGWDQPKSHSVSITIVAEKYNWFFQLWRWGVVHILRNHG